MSAIAAAFNNTSALLEMVKFIRSGSVDLPLNGIFAIERKGKEYKGIGLDPVHVIDEDIMGAMTTYRFFDLIKGKFKNIEGNDKIFFVTIEKVNAIHEEGTQAG